MKKLSYAIVLVLLCSSFIAAQESDNRAYNTQRRKPQTNSGILSGMVNNREVHFAEANVLMNVKPDAFVAVFAVVQEAPTAAESNGKVNQTIAAFLRDLEGFGIKKADTFVDFITQNKIYDYATSGNVTTEKFSGFETKKNVILRYRDRELLEKILTAAAKSAIYDLVKVDYVVADINAVHARLFDEAVRVIKQKEASYANSFGIRLAPTNFVNEKYDAFYPGELYAGYQAFESGTTYGDYNSRVIQQRKTRTFFLDALDASDFDAVINPAGVEPTVQFTLYLRMQYDLKK